VYHLEDGKYKRIQTHTHIYYIYTRFPPSHSSGQIINTPNVRLSNNDPRGPPAQTLPPLSRNAYTTYHDDPLPRTLYIITSYTIHQHVWPLYYYFFCFHYVVLSLKDQSSCHIAQKRTISCQLKTRHPIHATIVIISGRFSS